jgi:hypothetical protein
MNVPITFPTEIEVIAEESARFRALSPNDRVQIIGEMFRLYCFLQETFPNPQALARLAHEEKERERQTIKEFIARHV